MKKVENSGYLINPFPRTTYGLLKIVVFLFLWLCPGNIFSQPVCELKSNKKTVQIGEPFEIKISLTLEENYVVKNVSCQNIKSSSNTLFAKDSTYFEPFADIELLSSAPWKINSLSETIPLDNLPFIKNGTQKIYSNTFELAVYNPGIFLITGPILDSSEVKISSPLLIEVTVPLQDSTQNMVQDTLYPIKPIIIEPNHWTDYLIFLYILLAVLFTYFIYRYFKNRPKSKTTIEEIQNIPTKSPSEIALGKLNELEASKIWETSDPKEFQSSLTFILREYIKNRFNVDALEMTTQECVEALQKLNLVGNDHLNSARNILSVSDLVKFAKAKPTQDMYQPFFDSLRDFIEKSN
jgi:hypothetical protein